MHKTLFKAVFVYVFFAFKKRLSNKWQTQIFTSLQEHQTTQKS